MRRRIAAMALMLICVLGLFAGGVKITASAETNTFSGDVRLLKQDGSYYVMQVTVENYGEDFSGTVQLIFGSGNYSNCAYNTEITLPAQGKKQFTVTVTDKAADTMRGRCMLNFVDGKGTVLQSISLQNVFGNTVTGIPVGILSDDYSALTYLDMGGRDYSARGMYYPLELIELNASNIDGYLDGLFFLVIDRFNVASLGEEQIAAIQEWVQNGGWLIIGTGEYAEQTLSGFDEDFIGLEILDIYEPGEENFMSVNAHNGYYYSFEDAEIDYTKMAIAELTPITVGSGYYESGDMPSYQRSVGDGSMAVFFCSLGDEELKKLSYYAVESLYDNLMYNSNSYGNYYGSTNLNYFGQRALAFIDKRNTNVDFTWLEVLIAVYVVLVGPILYLILRKGKKREWYWVCAPVLGIAFIGCVYLFGQGTRVNGTKVYSVTVQKADSNREDTYFLAYHSGVDEWNMRLNDNYDVAGPGFSGYYSYYSSGGSVSSTSDYFYTVTNDSDGLSVGIKPDENFESGYLYAGGKTETKGAITGEGIKLPTGNIRGTVTNNTDYDLAYMAVWLDDYNYLAVYSDVAAGETIDLKQADDEGRCVYKNTVNYFDDLIYNMVGIYSNNMGYEQSDMAALLIGIGVAVDGGKSDNGLIGTNGYSSVSTVTNSSGTRKSTVLSNKGRAVLIGVIRDYEKTVADKSSEISYGCLYSYVETEVD